MPPFSNVNNCWIYQYDFRVTGRHLKELPLIFPSSCFFSCFSSSFTSSTTFLRSFLPLQLKFKQEKKLALISILSSLSQFSLQLFLNCYPQEFQVDSIFLQEASQFIQVYFITKPLILAPIMLDSSFSLRLEMFLLVQLSFFQVICQTQLTFVE